MNLVYYRRVINQILRNLCGGKSWNAACRSYFIIELREATPEEIWQYHNPEPQIIEGYGHPEGADKSRLYIEGKTVDVCRTGYRRSENDCIDIDECGNALRNGCHQERSICVNTQDWFLYRSMNHGRFHGP